MLMEIYGFVAEFDPGTKRYPADAIDIVDLEANRLGRAQPAAYEVVKAVRVFRLHTALKKPHPPALSSTTGSLPGRRA
jgi:hypothetical protein